jgi:nitrite reductase [NAD(P)H] large subunit
MPERLVVVGNGMAGARLVEEILGRNPAGFAITVIGAETHGNYNRILLPKVLAGDHDASDIFLNPPDWYEQNGVALVAGDPVAEIDRVARTVTTAGGAVHPYDVLVIATGARSAFPPVEGLRGHDGRLRPGIFGFRTLDDCDAMLEWAQTASRVAVVGGGLLGLEAGRALLERGLEVEIVQRSGRLMNLQLDRDAARMLRDAAERVGIRVQLDASTRRVLGDDRPEGLGLDDGRTLSCDMVVFATGTAPNVELAAAAGLPVERGILVDDGMHVLGCDDVYAVGECVQHRDAVYGLVAPLWEQVAVLADRLTGADPDACYEGSRPATKLKVSGVTLATMGIAEPQRDDDEVVCFSEPRRGVYKTAIVRDGKLVGAILLGDVSRAPYLLQALDRGTVLPEDRAGLLFELAWSGGATADEQALVCTCNGVTKAEITACAAAGDATLGAVASRTRATTGCGTCKADVVDILAAAAPRAPE